MIGRYGLPVFCKIDVEGYELDVLRGLSQPVAGLSLEFIDAAQELAAGCVTRLAELGDYEYNWSAGEQQRLQQTLWLAPQALLDKLSGPLRAAESGDIYARLKSGHPAA